LEKIIVAYSQDVQDYLDELIIPLFRKDYFSFEENAVEYVQKLSEYINQNIHKLPHKNSPEKLKKHGDIYVFYKSNKRTTGYFFFNKNGNKCLIKYITNSHNFDANFLV
jgi:transcriptional accessory protein Tex/SPT6